MQLNLASDFRVQRDARQAFRTRRFDYVVADEPSLLARLWAWLVG